MRLFVEHGAGRKVLAHRHVAIAVGAQLKRDSDRSVHQRDAGRALSDATFERVERAARRLGVSRSEFFARAAERWLDDLDDEGATDAINRAIADVPQDTAFTDAAAAALAGTDERA